MRKITFIQISVFSFLFLTALILGIATSYLLLGRIPLGDFRGVTLVVAAIVLVYLYAFVVYRVFLHFMPLCEGEIAERSGEELVAQVNTLFYLILFYSLTRTHFIPVPLMRLVYIALGARLGQNTYSGGAILDPPLTRIGANTIIGHDAVLFSHAIEGTRLALHAVAIGDNVTIGAHSVIMAGVTIGDGAIVSAGAVVTKGTCIASGEVWGGVPARRLRPASKGDETA